MQTSSVESKCDAVRRRCDLSVSPRFRWECLTSRTVSPFPHSAHQTGLAVFPHPAFGQGDSCFRPRKVGRQFLQPQQAQFPVEVLVGINPGPRTGLFVFLAQPVSEPIPGVTIHRPIGFTHRADTKEVGPPTPSAIEITNHLCRLHLPRGWSRHQANLLADSLDALPRRTGADVGLAGPRLVTLPERVS